MLSSAIRSSSPVLIPARTVRRSRSRVRPTTRPAARMRSICSGVLISTPRPSRPMAAGSALLDVVERVEDPSGHLVDLTGTVDLDEDAVAAVDLDERLGLLGVDLLPAPDDVLGVVGAALGLRAG